MGRCRGFHFRIRNHQVDGLRQDGRRTSHHLLGAYRQHQIYKKVMGSNIGMNKKSIIIAAVAIASIAIGSFVANAALLRPNAQSGLLMPLDISNMVANLGSPLTIVGATTSTVIASDTATSTISGNLVVNGGSITNASSIPFALVYSSSTPAIGGSELSPGACATATTTMSGLSTSSSVFFTSPQIYPGDGIWWDSYATSSTLIITRVCAAATSTPVSSVYNIKVIK